MTLARINDPLADPPPAEVPLRKAPLVRVIAQVRFPMVAAVEQRDFIAPFQEAIRATYPVLRQEQTQGVVVGQLAVASVQAKTAWRFSDADGRWRVSLTPDFVALETTAYESRSDFLKRLRDVLTALDSVVSPKLVDRIGIRYVDRITGSSVDEITALVRPEVLGIGGSPVLVHAQHTVSESFFVVEGTRLLTRWGLLPPNATVDPSTVEPIPEPSWILDLDMFTAEQQAFVIDEVLSKTQQFAERIYTFFRWVVTDEFLRRYGGDI